MNYGKKSVSETEFSYFPLVHDGKKCTCFVYQSPFHRSDRLCDAVSSLGMVPFVEYLQIRRT